MAVNILDSDSTTQWTANTASDTYVLQEDVYLAVLGTAISGTAAVTNRKFQIDGHVIADGGGSGMFIGQDATNGGSNTIAIGATGSVLGEAYGIVSHGGGLNLHNKGSVLGQTAGLFMTGSANVVHNEGSIVAFAGSGISSQGDDATLYNSGDITGDNRGVYLAGHYGYLLNTGNIWSSDYTENTAAVEMAGGKIVNLGTISGSGGVSILADTTYNTNVYNAGTLGGAVRLSENSDIFVNDGGTINGSVELGDGDDTFVYKGGFIADTVMGGSGDDEYVLYETGIDISDDSGARDQFVSYVSVTLSAGIEALYLMGQNDLTGRGNGLDNEIRGNAGDNRLFGRGGNDTLFAGQGEDLYDGGAGRDTISFTNFDGGVSVNLATGRGSGGAMGHRYKAVENVEGSWDNDQIAGSGGVNRLDGGYGRDIIFGGGGKDTFVFVDGNDKDTIMDFRDGEDRIDFTFVYNGTIIDFFAELKPFIHQKGGDVVMDFSSVYAGQVLVLHGVDKSDLSAADFLFA